jgi:tol-pal system protein YbgF
MAYRIVPCLAVGALMAAVASPAGAQSAGADRRMERLEQSMRTLQATVLQAQATGQPVVVRPEGPDPMVLTMQERVTDLEQTIQRLNGQVETLTLEVEQARRADAAASADRATALQTLTERLGRLDAQMNTLMGAMAPEDLSALGPNDARTAPDATGQAQAGASGTLGGQLAAAQPPPANAGEAFTRAQALMNASDYEAAAAAFQDFVARYPTNARTPEAYYWIGESFFARRGYQTATAAYANALRDRPTGTWAPAAMARLAQSLAFSNQAAQACAALAEFNTRYAARASAAVKTNAQAARTRARCT